MQKAFESLAFISALPHGDPLYGKFENSKITPLKFNPTAPQLPKNEAIQTSLFIDVLVTVFIRNASTPKSKSTSR